MQIPSNPTNQEMREAILQLADQLKAMNQKLEQLNRKLEQRSRSQLSSQAPDYGSRIARNVRIGIAVIVVTAVIVSLMNLSPVIATIVTALSASNH